ncbi:hypothetical protein [Marinovum sp.]|uniref:hypothetical protein n=1 Tax=Marinovum sp. TaxID=2024839 RepID=UPI002B273CDE|nr:hypothetical protein [Marinovum sp.]
MAGFLYAFSLHKDYVKDQQNADTPNSIQSDFEIKACREIPSILAKITCVGRAIASQDEKSTAEKDLKVQQHMSLWAFGMAAIALATLAITGGGVVFVYLTLRETAAGVLVMRKEQRAWLWVEDVQVQDIHAGPEIDENGQTWIWISGTITVRNSGHSAARASLIAGDLTDTGRNQRIQEISRAALRNWKAGEGTWIAPNASYTQKFTKVYKFDPPPPGVRGGAAAGICISIAYANGVDSGASETFRIANFSQYQNPHTEFGPTMALDLNDVINGAVVLVVEMFGHGEMT